MKGKGWASQKRGLYRFWSEKESGQCRSDEDLVKNEDKRHGEYQGRCEDKTIM